MNESVRQIGYKLTIVLLLLIICYQCSSRNSCETIFKHTIDTFIVEKIDTFLYPDPVYLTKHTIDTLYLDNVAKDSTIALPIVQKHFGDTMYDAWISGIEPLGLDSLKLYNRTTIQYIKDNSTTQVIPKRTEIYVFGGLNSIDGNLIPKIGISITTKNDWLISPEIGLHGNNAYYGVSVGKKIKF